MSTIYDLNKEQSQLLDALFWEEDNELIQQQLNNVTGQIEKKLAFLTTILAETRADIETKKAALKEAKDRLEKQVKRSERAELRLKEFIRNAMLESGIKKIEGDIMTVIVVNHDKLLLADNFDAIKSNMPNQFLTIVTETKIDKRGLLGYLKEGNEVDGAFVVNEPFLKEV